MEDMRKLYNYLLALMNLDKHSCLARATALLAAPTHENLRYAALELRLCIEAITYEKLRTYSNMVPLSVPGDLAATPGCKSSPSV